MAIKISQGLRQSQNLAMTPQLQQAIKLLTLTHLEMTNVIAEEMVENPMLEEAGNEVDIDTPSEGDNEVREATSDDFSEAPLMKDKDDFKKSGINWKHRITVEAMGFNILGHQIHHLQFIQDNYFPLEKK